LAQRGDDADDNGAAGIGINQLGTAFNGLAARGQNPTLSSQSLRRQARELSLAPGGSAPMRGVGRYLQIVGSITDRAMRVGIHD
jgi:hypothetical protein